MKSMIVFVCLLAVACALPQNYQQQTLKVPAILSQDAVVNADGSFRSSFETEDGIKRQESGALKQVGPKSDEVAEVVQGQVVYSDKEGNTFDLRYTADENGYRAEGAHLPVAPAIPAEIARSIEYNLAHPEEDESQKYTS